MSPQASSSIVRPVILCGGAGTRLWPLSRQQFPKQLLALIGEDSLLQQTAERVRSNAFAPALVVSGEDQRFFIKRQLEEAGARVEAILLEPTARNTSSAAALAAAWLTSSGRDELLLLMPSDHAIADPEAFVAAIEAGAGHAEQGAIVTFGVRPSEPNTQYGYIEADTAAPAGEGAFPVARFAEKPDADTAAEFVASGRFFWNAGIFLVKASTLLDEMRQFLPASLESIVRAVRGASVDGLFVRPEGEAFAAAQNISIDHGIMEKTSRGMVVPVDMGWSDVGSWDAVWKLGDKDLQGNVTLGDVVARDTANSLIRSEGKALLATVGVDNMAIVAVGDAIFVSPLDRASEVKDLVEGLRQEGRDCVLLPAKVARPWGSYESIGDGPRFQVKHIVVDAGETLSLQMHHHRSEHWVIVRGSAEVTVGEQVSILQENQSTYIPAGTRHRLANPGKVPLELIEVQCGPYLGEDDIVRFEDQYGRAKSRG